MGKDNRICNSLERFGAVEKNKFSFVCAIFFYSNAAKGKALVILVLKKKPCETTSKLWSEDNKGNSYQTERLQQTNRLGKASFFEEVTTTERRLREELLSIRKQKLKLI